MNTVIKTRLDAIDAQMAELQKEQAKLREELDKPEFVPGWYMMGDPDNRTPENRVVIDWVATESLCEWKKASYPGITPFTPELAARFFKKTRYDWAKIVKDYPEAKWASTDKSGRVDLWTNKPIIRPSLLMWDALHHIQPGGYAQVGETPDWRDSLEAARKMAEEEQ